MRPRMFPLGLALALVVPIYLEGQPVLELIRAAEQGRADAQYELGFLYDTGQGIPEGIPHDDSEAVRWYRMAAEGGHAYAQYQLGLMFHYGLDIPQDFAEAMRWTRMAVEQEDVAAQNFLRNIYARGEGGPQDFVLAHVWYNISAANGGAYSRPDRARMEERMTPAQVARAQEIARVCMASGYQECN